MKNSSPLLDAIAALRSFVGDTPTFTPFRPARSALGLPATAEGLEGAYASEARSADLPEPLLLVVFPFSVDAGRGFGYLVSGARTSRTYASSGREFHPDRDDVEAAARVRVRLLAAEAFARTRSLRPSEAVVLARVRAAVDARGEPSAVDLVDAEADIAVGRTTLRG